ncbi:MAG: TRAP transporter small permease [Oscillospiraceae bacterium]
MKIIKKISGFLNSILGYVSFVAFFVIMAFIVINVFMRFALDAPVLGAYEIVEQMMFVGVFCSFAYAQQQGSHIRVSMLLLHLPKRAAMAVCCFTSLCGTGILGLLTYAAGLQFKLALAHSYTTAMLKFPIAPFYALEIVCSVIFAIAVLVEAIEYGIGIFSKAKAEELAAKF